MGNQASTADGGRASKTEVSHGSHGQKQDVEKGSSRLEEDKQQDQEQQVQQVQEPQHEEQEEEKGQKPHMLLQRDSAIVGKTEDFELFGRVSSASESTNHVPFPVLHPIPSDTEQSKHLFPLATMLFHDAKPPARLFAQYIPVPTRTPAATQSGESKEIFNGTQNSQAKPSDSLESDGAPSILSNSKKLSALMSSVNGLPIFTPRTNKRIQKVDGACVGPAKMFFHDADPRFLEPTDPSALTSRDSARSGGMYPESDRSPHHPSPSPLSSLESQNSLPVSGSRWPSNSSSNALAKSHSVSHSDYLTESGSHSAVGAEHDENGDGRVGLHSSAPTLHTNLDSGAATVNLPHRISPHKFWPSHPNDPNPKSPFHSPFASPRFTALRRSSLSPNRSMSPMYANSQRSNSPMPPLSPVPRNPSLPSPIDPSHPSFLSSSSSSSVPRVGSYRRSSSINAHRSYPHPIAEGPTDPALKVHARIRSPSSLKERYFQDTEYPSHRRAQTFDGKVTWSDTSIPSLFKQPPCPEVMMQDKRSLSTTQQHMPPFIGDESFSRSWSAGAGNSPAQRFLNSEIDEHLRAQQPPQPIKRAQGQDHHAASESRASAPSDVGEVPEASCIRPVMIVCCESDPTLSSPEAMWMEITSPEMSSLHSDFSSPETRAHKCPSSPVTTHSVLSVEMTGSVCPSFEERVAGPFGSPERERRQIHFLRQLVLNAYNVDASAKRNLSDVLTEGSCDSRILDMDVSFDTVSPRGTDVDDDGSSQDDKDVRRSGKGGWGGRGGKCLLPLGLFDRADKDNSAEAQFEMGARMHFLLLTESADISVGEQAGFVAYDAYEGEALDWYYRATKENHAWAFFALGVHHLLHRAEQEGDDNQVAFSLLEAAADQGLAEAQWYVGLMMLIGDGTKKDEAKAIKWLHKAADKGHKGALSDLVVCYLTGWGTHVDTPKGRALMRRAKSSEAGPPSIPSFFPLSALPRPPGHILPKVPFLLSDQMLSNVSNIPKKEASDHAVHEDSAPEVRWSIGSSSDGPG